MRVVELAEAADPSRAGQDTTPGAALRQVADQIVPAIEFLIDNEPPAALRLVGALSDYWQEAGRVDEGRALTEKALERGHPAANPDIAAVRPRALLAASDLAFRQGDQAQATKLAQDCIRAAIYVEDRVTASLAHSNLARVAYRNRDAAEIERQSRKALELAGDDHLANRSALHMLAWAAHTAGDLDEAERRFETSLAYRRKVAGRISVAVEIANLGDLAAQRGDLPKAARLLGEVMQISHKVGSRYMLVNTYPSIAALCDGAGRPEDAARLFGAADAIARTSGLMPDPGTTMAESRAATKAALGEERFAELHAEGERLSTDDAVALSLRIARELTAE